ncbi:patatin-like phospholipase family protein [Pseudomonas fluorescens group sp. PF-1]
MPYHVEVICYSEKLYSDTGAAIRLLNHAQDANGASIEIAFALPPVHLRRYLYSHRLEQYLTDDIFAQLKEYRSHAKGDRRYLIAIVDGRLSSSRFTKLFGSHNAEQGLAVITTHGFDSYVASRKSYLAFFLTRFAMSFIAPERMSHEDEPSCIFHKRRDRTQLTTALYHGIICDDCRKAFAAKINVEIDHALELMLGLIRLGLPPEGSTLIRERRALVLKGGGVKGLALVGALLELERWYEFDEFIGTSAGSIVAALMALGCSAGDLERILRKTDFGSFKDSSLLSSMWSAVRVRYLHSGRSFEEWFWSQVKQSYIARTGKVQPPMMRDADRHLVVFATQRNVGLVRFDSEDPTARQNHLITFAVRASMSIPGFFKPPTEQGQPIYDGGLLANFPLKEWIDLYPDRPFLGIYLGPYVLDPLTKSNLVDDVVEIATTRDDYQIIDANRDDVVMVDPSPIGTTEFSLGKEDMDFLVLEGRASALEHMARRLKDSEVKKLAQIARANAIRAKHKVGTRKVKKHQVRRVWIAVVVALVVAVLVWFRWG